MLIADDLAECQGMIDEINANLETQLVSVADNILIWRVTRKGLRIQQGGIQKSEMFDDPMMLHAAKLDELGMKPSLKGRKYLLDALLLLDEGIEKQRVSEMIAAKYKRSEESVRGAMKRAIQTTWDAMPSDLLREKYTAKLRPNKTAPTVMEFLHYYI